MLGDAKRLKKLLHQFQKSATTNEIQWDLDVLDSIATGSGVRTIAINQDGKMSSSQQENMPEFDQSFQRIESPTLIQSPQSTEAIEYAPIRQPLRSLQQNLPSPYTKPTNSKYNKVRFKTTYLLLKLLR
jgi:hypothetical protein